MRIYDLFPEDSKRLLVVRGRDLLDTLGLKVIREVVAQVLQGVNVRDATEVLTQRRIALLSLALVETYSKLFAQGLASKDVIDKAYTELTDGQCMTNEKILLRWMLGLTKKQVDNVLRSDEKAWIRYIENLKSSQSSVAKDAVAASGESSLIPVVGSGGSWEASLSVLTAVGSQTLGTRGSEKSLYGKLFEKLVMGSVLSVLGFELSESGSLIEKGFVLSTTAKRESDASLLWPGAKGIRFDIGFIGKGNPEITLDKMSRFDKREEVGGELVEFRTFVIVDTVGAKSKILSSENAKHAVVIQMSQPNWVAQLGAEIGKVLPEYSSPLDSLQGDEFVAAISSGVEKAPLEQIFSIAARLLPESEAEEADA